MSEVTLRSHIEPDALSVRTLSLRGTHFNTCKVTGQDKVKIRERLKNLKLYLHSLFSQDEFKTCAEIFLSLYLVRQRKKAHVGAGNSPVEFHPKCSPQQLKHQAKLSSPGNCIFSK